MVTFPNAKINLGLHICSKRIDGFHELQTVFVPVGVCDVLEIVVAAEGQIEDVKLVVSGAVLDGTTDDNLCVKAYRLLATDYSLPNVSMHLMKVIPFGAGLGGGSADAAFVIKALNDLCELGCSDKQLMEYAAQLGSDCAFFIKNRPALGEGRGELLSDVAVDLLGLYIVLVNPGIPVSTKVAFSNVIPSTPNRSLKDLVGLPLHEWRSCIVNDFENSIFSVYPEIAKIKERLYELGAGFALMSGSGSTVYGLFSSKKAAEEAASAFEGCFVWLGKFDLSA